MSAEERRTVVATTGVLLLASLVRLGWEARPVPPILPPQPVSTELLEGTRAEVARAERMATPLADGERIDPNSDPDVELARLPGIGPALARGIVETRGRLGGFRTPDDLLEVSGIGPATLARIRPHLDLSHAPAPGVGDVPDHSGVPSGGSPLSMGGGDRLDVNAAGVEELQRLPGIGPALAARIVEHRARVGGFTRPEALQDVPGIGPATLARLLPLIRAD